jgi:hypothetical protein
LGTLVLENSSLKNGTSVVVAVELISVFAHEIFLVSKISSEKRSLEMKDKSFSSMLTYLLRQNIIYVHFHQKIHL